MIESLGGPKVPAIGFAMGLERILATMPRSEIPRGPGAYLLPLAAEGADKALILARELRALGVATEVDGRGGKLKTMLGRAERRGAALCVILGEEVARGVVSVKQLATRTQEELPLEGAARIIADRLRALPAQPAAPPEPRGSR
jgi:histidyl-tRNA synthetase